MKNFLSFGDFHCRLGEKIKIPKFGPEELVFEQISSNSIIRASTYFSIDKSLHLVAVKFFLLHSIVLLVERKILKKV